MDYGADYLGPSMGGPSNAPWGRFDTLSDPKNRKFTRAEILDAYGKNDPGKGQDLERLMKNLPGDAYTLDELRGLSTKDLSARSGAAWNSSLGELESLAKSSGAGMGGVNKGPGGYGAAMLPIAQQAVEQSLQATSNAARGLTTQAAGSKGGGAANPYFQQQIARTRMLGDQATAQVPSQLVERFLMSSLPLAFGQAANAAAAGGNAAGIGAGLYGSNLGAQATLGAGMGAGLGALGEGIGRGYMNQSGSGANTMGGVRAGGSSTAPAPSGGGGSWWST
jgi:hypothetical protein